MASKKKNNKLPIKIFICALSVLIIILVLFSFVNRFYSSTNTPTIKDLITETPIPTIDTSNWQVYSDEHYKFSFKYPSDWVKEQQEKSDMAQAYSMVIAPNSSNLKEEFGTNVKIILIPYKGLPEEWYKNVQGMSSNNVISNNLIINSNQTFYTKYVDSNVANETYVISNSKDYLLLLSLGGKTEKDYFSYKGIFKGIINSVVFNIK